jgi:secreted trypsin-like serine protease
MSSIGDAALILLDRPVVGVPLIKINGISTKPSDGQSVTVIGHGATSNQDTLPNSLMKVSQSVISHQDCNDKNSYDGSIVFSAMLYAGAPEGGKGDCYGDSENPLLIRGNNPNEDIQVGIVSFGADS